MLSLNRPAGAVSLEFVFVFPLLVALLYGGAVYGMLFFHKAEMQEAVDKAVASVFYLDRRQFSNFGDEVLFHSEAALEQLSERLPQRVRSRISEQQCREVSDSGVAILECSLMISGKEPMLPQLNLGALGRFPPQPESMSVSASVAF